MKIFLNKNVMIGLVILAIWLFGGMSFITRNPILIFFAVLAIIIVKWGGGK